MSKKVDASIITIGDELLIGQVIDTNSAFIARRLNKIGISVKRRLAVADETDDIVNALEEEIPKADLIITTGGLGPTSDDITKPALAKFFNTKLVMNKTALEHIEKQYSKIFHKKLNEANRGMAMLPENCEVLVNRRGSAPCMIFEKEGKYIISMPGVPYEMEGIMDDLDIWLKNRLQLPKIIHQTLITLGIAESDLAAHLKGFEEKLPSFSKLAYLPGPSGLRLRISSTVFNENQEKEANKQFTSLKSLTKDFLEAPDGLQPQESLGIVLTKMKASVSTAESCTGGRIASLITSVSGSSAYYPGSVVSYSNEIKEKVLKVKKSTLEKYGAVSEQTVREMLKGIIEKMKTTYGIAVSGIMGPAGGSKEKPVGTVWMAVGTADNIQTQKISLRYGRQRNTEATANIAMYMLVNFIRQEKKNN